LAKLRLPLCIIWRNGWHLLLFFGQLFCDSDVFAQAASFAYDASGAGLASTVRGLASSYFLFAVAFVLLHNRRLRLK
jgi:hypothetical protein